MEFLKIPVFWSKGVLIDSDSYSVWTDLINRKDFLFGSYAFLKYQLMAALIEVSVAF